MDDSVTHLTDKLDSHLKEWETDMMDLQRLIRADECPSWALAELGLLLSANILPRDSDKIKRVKVHDAVKNQKLRGSWLLIVKDIVDEIAGYDSALVHIKDTDEWVLLCGDESEEYHWSILGAGDDSYSLYPSVGDEIYRVGNILIDCHQGIHVATLIADQIADLIFALRTDVLPAYMKIFLGYVDSVGNFVVYSEVT